MYVPFVVITFAQLATGSTTSATQALTAAAAASPRPSECRPARDAGRLSTETLWDRAREPALRRYCRFLALGYSRLARSPKSSIEGARRAEEAFPGRAAPAVLEGRAALGAGLAKKAYEAFSRARRLDRRSLEQPEALHDWAVAAAKTDHATEALAAYRALVPRAGLLDDRRRRQRVYVEAAARVMDLGARVDGADRGALLDEAMGYLDEARRSGTTPGFEDVVLGALALVLDRRGRREEARGVAREAQGPWGLAGLAPDGDRLPARVEMPVLPAGTFDAMVAVLAEVGDRDVARDRWRAFLRHHDGGPWADHAKERLAALGRNR